MKFNYLFICAGTLEELKKRLIDRGKETEEQIAKRMKTAKEEMEALETMKHIYTNILDNSSTKE